MAFSLRFGKLIALLIHHKNQCRKEKLSVNKKTGKSVIYYVFPVKYTHQDSNLRPTV